MYASFFGLSGAPFRITPDTRRFFSGAGRGAVLEALVYAVTSGEGIVKVVGEIGSGKTMLCRMLTESLPAGVSSVYLANPSLTRAELLTAIARELGLELSTDTPRLDALHALQAALLERHAAGGRVVVFVEEAQGMPAETLEEIRFLSNLETREGKLLQLVLFGQPELDATLARRDMRPLRDRITHAFSLGPLSAADTRDYLGFRLQAAGHRGRSPFTATACHWLARASRGLIRRINVLADKALLAAYAEGSVRVNWRHVRRAAADGALRARWHLRGWMALAASLVLAGLWVGALTAGAGTASRIATARVAVAPAPLPGTGPVRAKALRTPPPRTLSAAAAESTPGSASERPALEKSYPSLVGERLQATRAWLSASGDARYTVQVMLSHDSDPERVEDVLADPSLRAHLDRLYVCATLVHGKRRWVVLYGTYPDAAAARAALAGLPAPLRDNDPYPRTLGAVRRHAQLEATPGREDLS